jgi:lipopolysaccharide export system protein LptA
VRWQTVARRIVAVVGLGTAVAIYVYTRPRPAPEPPPLAPSADPTATVQAGAGVDARYRDDTLESKVQYAGIRQYSDGRVGYEKAHMTLANGTVLSADLIEGRGKSAKGDMPGEWTLTGHVSFQGPKTDPVAFSGASATYSDATGVATMPGLVTFRRGRMSGTGTGGTYQRDAGVFALAADAHVTIAPGTAGESAIDATSRTMTFQQAGKSVVFDQDARLARDTDTMTASRATLYLSDDEQTFKAIELRGNSAVAPLPGRTSDLPEMRADDIDLAFYDGTTSLQRAHLARRAVLVQTAQKGRRSIEAPQIDLAMAPDGRTLTHLEANPLVEVNTPAAAGVPARLITARTLVATGTDAAGLTAAVFDGGVRFVETVPGARGAAPSTRTGTAARLAMKIKGSLDAIDEATFERNVRFTDADVVGDGDVGIYRAAKGELELRPADQHARRPPHVTDGSMVVDAEERIIIALDSHDLSARRKVSTVSRGTSSEKNASGDAGLFNDSDPVYGSSDELIYRAEAKSAEYTGTDDAPARVRQGDDSIIVGHTIEIVNSRNLKASGAVDTTFLMTGDTDSTTDTPAAGPVKYHATSETLVYDDEARTAVFEGTPAVLARTDGRTTANRIMLLLEPDARKLRQLDASGKVHATLSDGREAYGDTLRYDARADRYLLIGEPLAPLALLTKDADGTCSIATGTTAHFSGDLGAPSFLDAENPAGSFTKPKQPCVAPAGTPR